MDPAKAELRKSRRETGIAILCKMKLLETIQEGIYITRQDNMQREVFWP
jgi:hypothetical protein